MATLRITVTLPAELAQELDRAVRNRSRFVAEAIRKELDLRRRDALQASLSSPHPETAELADVGWSDWVSTVAEGDEGLVDRSRGNAVRWSPEAGWVEEE